MRTPLIDPALLSCGVGSLHHLKPLPSFLSGMIENWFAKNSFLNIFKISGDLTKCEDRVAGPRRRECLSLKKQNKKNWFFCNIKS